MLEVTFLLIAFAFSSRFTLMDKTVKAGRHWSTTITVTCMRDCWVFQLHQASHAASDLQDLEVNVAQRAMHAVSHEVTYCIENLR
jgi:hypothetical protein